MYEIILFRSFLEIIARLFLLFFLFSLRGMCSATTQRRQGVGSREQGLMERKGKGKREKEKKKKKRRAGVRLGGWVYVDF